MSSAGLAPSTAKTWQKPSPALNLRYAVLSCRSLVFGVSFDGRRFPGHSTAGLHFAIRLEAESH